jgi:CelD/BcsL family acetyltransferase involved in cellulose biosynthesis
MTWQLIPCTRFAEHAAAWDALQRATTNVPFLDAAFIGPLLQTFGDGKELLALHKGAGGTLDAAAIVTPLGRGQWQTFQPSQLPLGPWLAPRQDGLEARADGLLRALPGFALSLGLTQLDPLLQARPASSERLGLLDYIDTSSIDIEGPWEAYWEARGKNLRQNTRKQHNKLQAEGTAPTIECVTDPTAVADALADYGALESAGWKAGGGTAIHPDNDQGHFYRRMLENFFAAGRGRLVRYRFGAKVVAMDLCIDNGPLVVVLKTAYDETFRQVSPSTLMRHDEFQQWWGEGRYRRIEFYGKTMEWHTRWTEHKRTLFHATVYRWPVLRRLAARRQARGADANNTVSTVSPSGGATDAQD